MVDEPHGDLGYYGADVAAPAFAEIGKTAVQVLGIAARRRGELACPAPPVTPGATL